MSTDQESLVALLIDRLNDLELTVRVHSGLQLEGMGIEVKPALPALLQMQRSEDVHNRRLAAVVLGSLGNELAEAGTLLDILHAAGSPDRYVVESSGMDGVTVWLGDFAAEELEPLE